MSCSTFEVLRKLQPKQARAIVSFAITDATEVDSKIRNLFNLKALDLSGNGITILNLPPLPSLTHLNVSSNNVKNINPSVLPRSLVNLDISYNALSDIPKELALLQNLQYLNISGNPVHCSCPLIEVRNALKDANVIVNDPVLCATPSYLKKVSWNSDEICPSKGIWDQMLGDEGSGSGDSALVPEIGTYGEKIEDEFLTDLHSATSSTDNTEYEGSGDDIENEFRNNPPKPCYINCSTPPPLPANDTNSTISAIDGARILFEDISGKKVEETTTTTKVPHVHEETIAPVSSKPLESVPSPKTDDEVNNSTTTAPSTAVAAPKKSRSTYILLAVLCIVIVMIIVFAIYKTRTNRRNKKRRQTDADNGINKKPMQEMTELAPLTKLPDQEVNNTHKTNGTKNGKTVEETEDYNDGVELRKKQESEALLTPEAKRVTIKAGEIPGSVPRTPLLVNRHISSDGNVITIPSLDQRV